jgi:hypothetical protein
MQTRPLAIRRELVEALKDVQFQIDEIKREADRPFELRSSDGNWVMVPLLSARAQLLHAIVIMNAKEK